MWIYTQNKKQIVHTKDVFSIDVNVEAFSKGRTSILALTANGMSAKTLGTYDNEKCAIDELENLFKAIDEGRKTYQMP